MVYEVLRPLSNVRMGMNLHAADGSPVLTSYDAPDGARREPGAYSSVCAIPGQLLNDGLYRLTAVADVPYEGVLFVADDVLTFSVERTDGVPNDHWPGVVRPRLPWAIRRA
jgi:hypothetical protein